MNTPCDHGNCPWSTGERICLCVCCYSTRDPSLSIAYEERAMSSRETNEIWITHRSVLICCTHRPARVCSPFPRPSLIPLRWHFVESQKTHLYTYQYIRMFHSLVKKLLRRHLTKKLTPVAFESKISTYDAAVLKPRRGVRPPFPFFTLISPVSSSLFHRSSCGTFQLVLRALTHRDGLGVLGDLRGEGT